MQVNAWQGEEEDVYVRLSSDNINFKLTEAVEMV
jgi:hypothetical protein